MLVSLLRRARNMGASIRLAWVNGRPGAVLYDADWRWPA
jgi:RNA polymerase sigma-70 factor (ECF subfamily)